MKTPVQLLYIEDDEIDRHAFLRMVREKNLPYNLRTAETLAEARAHLAKSPFDVIVADYHLPDGNCTELFDEIPNTPILLLTGTLEEQLALRTLERGFDDYLAKDPQQRHLEAVPFAVEKTLYRHHLRGVEERLTRELREQDRRMRLAQQATGVGTFEWDIPHNRVTWSPELERLYGLPPGGFGGSYETWLACLHPEDRPEAELQHQRALATGRMEGDWRVIWPDGTVRWLSGRATVEKDAAGKPLRMLGVNIDITDRKVAEAEVAGLRDRLNADLAGMNRLHELSTRFVSRDDLQTLLDAILDAAIDITGADKGHVQLLNIASGELGITSQRGFDKAFVEFFNHIRAGVVACGTAMQTRLCVVVEDVMLSSLFLVEPRALELVLASGMRGVVCTPLLTRTSQLVGVLSILFAAPHRPSERDLRLLDLMARQAADFIERTGTEEALRTARQELARANQDLERKVQERTASLKETIAELEQFSYTITHDMRAPLRAMRSFASMLMEECGNCLSPIRRDYLQRIAISADRMDHLILDALDYSKVIRQDMPITPVDADALLRGMIDSYPAFQPPQAEIKLEGKLPPVMANQAGLTQCFSNLLGNAVKFVEPGHVPQVVVRAESRDDCVRLWFEDKGIGISPEVHDRIFDMFQRVNKEYEGTGIGLALVHKNVERMGGKVGVESEPGRGSRFWLDLKQAS